MARWHSSIRQRRYYQKASEKYKDLVRSRKLLSLAKYAFLGVIALFLIIFIALPLFAFNLPTPEKVVRREGFSTKILDRNGEVLYDIYQDERRTPVNLNDIPNDLKNATIAIEDKNFYKHQGFDIFGMVRGVSRLFTRGFAQGGSTLTQQLVKNVLLTSERSLVRKAKEFILAVQIERKYSKDEILTMYLNEAPYGGNIWGVQSAAQVYYGKEVKELNLTESAILAGIPQRPSVYSPYSSEPESFKARTENVLRRMREDGYITDDQEKEAIEQIDNIEFQEKGATFKAPHFVLYVQKLLEERFGERAVELGGLKVTTSLDYKLQEEAQKIVSEEIDKVKDSYHITNGAAIVIDPKTSEILAMVGSRNFSDPDYDGQVNVTLSLRQPGSAIKPITYVSGFKNGFTPSTMIMDVPTTFPGGEGQPPYEPGNYDGKYRGPIQVRYALGNSINVPAVKMLAMVGISDMLSTAYDLGISSLEPTKETLQRVGLAVTLGGGEVKLIDLTGAYGAFMNGGKRVDPIAILKVEDLNGKVLEETKIKEGKKVLTEGQAYLIADILSDNSARSIVFGPNSLLNIPGRTVAVKTGTTNDRRDNWAIGGNSNAVIGVWVGNNDNSEMKSVASGVSGASPIWRRITLAALSDKPNVGFTKPSEIIEMDVDSVSGYKAHDGFSSRKEIFIKGTEPGEDPVHVMLKLCKNDGKLATPADIAAGNYDSKEYFLFKEEDPTARAGGENMWQKGILNWIFSQNEPKYNPPTEYCGATNPIVVGFDTPSDRSSNLDNSFNVKIKADSTDDITEVTLIIDGVKERGFSSRPFETQVTLSDGVHKLKAIARDAKGRENQSEITVGVSVPWDYSPTPSPTPTPLED